MNLVAPFMVLTGSSMLVWLKRLLWWPYLLAYVLPSLAAGFTLASLNDQAWTHGHSLLGTWVELILAQILLVVIGAFIINEREPERLTMAIAHAVIAGLACPLAILGTLVTKGFLHIG